MKQDLVHEIIDCLPRGRTLFYYFRDRYALMLLSYFVDKGKTIKEIKKSRLGGFLNKSSVKNITKNISNGILRKEHIDSVWPAQPECYLLTLGKWGSRSYWDRNYYQTSRPGFNLVLQLNFSMRHNRQYYRLIKPSADGHPFQEEWHPIARKGFHTLAWARMDIDFNADEALIEELQNDWIRNAIYEINYAESMFKKVDRDPSEELGYMNCSFRSLKIYFNQVLKPHISLWDEALLSAAIWFLKEEIGIKRIFYHTFKTKCFIKQMSGWKPPKSIYSSLPRKFLFEETKEFPEFFNSKKNRKIRHLLNNMDSRFYFLEI